MAVDLLSDLFLNSVFDREEIERERGVVLQEISQVEDAPEEYVHDLFNLDFLGDHPLSRPICGEASIVSAFQREDLVGFLEHRYLPGRVIIVAAGNVDHADLVSRIEKEFSSLKGRPLEDAARPRNSVAVFASIRSLWSKFISVWVPWA